MALVSPFLALDDDLDSLPPTFGMILETTAFALAGVSLAIACTVASDATVLPLVGGGAFALCFLAVCSCQPFAYSLEHDAGDEASVHARHRHVVGLTPPRREADDVAAPHPASSTTTAAAADSIAARVSARHRGAQ